jgi:hypothetical protein
VNSQDWANADSARNQAIAQLAEICAAMGLSWSADEKIFTIDLPDVISMKATAEVIYKPTQRKSFDISTWGPAGVDENEITNLPDNGELLDEGEAPKGDPDAEA